MNINDFVAWVLRNPVVTAILIIALGILAGIVILAFIQGREISIGQLKIGTRPKELSGKEGAIFIQAK